MATHPALTRKANTTGEMMTQQCAPHRTMNDILSVFRKAAAYQRLFNLWQLEV